MVAQGKFEEGLRWNVCGFWGLLFFTILIVRIVWVFQKNGPLLPPNLQCQTLRTLIILGSGGHTAELLHILQALNLQRYAPRYYIAGSNDVLSLPKAKIIESHFLKDFEYLNQDTKTIYKSLQMNQYTQIYQSCKSNQLNITLFFKTLRTFVEAIIQVLRVQPDVILCNGPGTCFPICVVGFFLKVIGWKLVVVVYVESIARVKTLSRTGFLLYHLRLVDQMFVQWSNLRAKYPRVNLCKPIF